MTLQRTTRFLVFGFLLLAISAVLSAPSAAQIAVGVSVRIAPPALPVYEQPICPGPGHLWTPGYWAWSDDNGYYWVPGTWVVAPVGLLWTPGYWGWHDGMYGWHAGYWGPHIGFYGGVNYGFGYGGVGFGGGEWRHGAFFYNTAVMHVDTVHVTNVYVNRTVIVNNTSHVAFNGGQGGVVARPTAAEQAAAREPHRAALAEQVKQQHSASQNRSLFASANHGRPAIAATARPGQFSGHGVVQAKAAGAAYHAPAMSPRQARATAPANHTTAANHAASHPVKEAPKPAAHASTAPRNQTTAPKQTTAQKQTAPQKQTMARNQNPRTDSHTPGSHPAPSLAKTESRPQTATHSEPSHAQSAPKAKPAPAPAHQSATPEKHAK